MQITKHIFILCGKLLKKLDSNETGIDDFLADRLINLGSNDDGLESAKQVLNQASEFLSKLDDNDVGMDDKAARFLNKIANHI